MSKIIEYCKKLVISRTEEDSKLGAELSRI